MDRWFRHDPQAQEGFLNLGCHFLSRIPRPRKVAQEGGSCARGSNKYAKGRFLLQRCGKIHFWWGTWVTHQNWIFPHRCSEKLENGLQKVVSKCNFPLVILTRHVKTKHKSKRERASAPDLCCVCPRIATRARGKGKFHFQ